MNPAKVVPSDPSSYAKPEHARITNYHLDWTISFEEKIITGSSLIDFEIIDATVNQLVLDSRELNISRIVCEDSGQTLNYELSKHNEIFGSKLKISLPSELQSKKISIRIFYSTSPNSAGLQWLNPNQTSGNKYPFLYSQCQAIHARSIMPCQDTPSIKSTFTAVVKCDSNLVALMGALRDEEIQKDGDLAIYRFHQPVAIPSYLLAIVVGDLVSESLGPRCRVWAEKELIEKAAYEFSETEKMLSVAESLCGKYVWKEYGLLILPPSFPYGGMENPNMTFVTPALLAGDRSLADVIAHEICHSWTGNLVTNCNWEHFWLNEGFTMFLERKIQERLHGKSTRHLQAIEGWEDLKYTVKIMGETDPMTCLVMKMDGIDPDDSYSSIPYEKGHTFLWYLENLVGGAEEFEPFLKAYLDKYHHQVVDSDDFKSFFLSYFHRKESELKEIDWDTWFYSPGMPKYDPKFDTTLIDSCIELCKSWEKWDTENECPFTEDDLSKFSSKQIIVWLSKLLDYELSLEKIKKMDEIYLLSDNGNADIKFRWLRLCIKVRWIEKLDDILNFINSQGRLKYVRPIYRDLYEWEDVREKAVSNFTSTKHLIMHVSVQTLSKDLHLV